MKRRCNMGLFSKDKKPKIIMEIYDAAWGCLACEHKISVGTLAKEIRCVDKPGVIDGGGPVTFLRVFSLSEVGTERNNRYRLGDFRRTPGINTLRRLYYSVKQGLSGAERGIEPASLSG